jgi:hypothetical protein
MRNSSRIPCPKSPEKGLWKTASEAPSTFKIYVPDPVSQEAGFLGMMMESGKPVEIGLRFKLRDGQIVEMEHLIPRNLSPASLANLQTPRTGLLAMVPAAEWLPRERTVSILKIRCVH